MNKAEEILKKHYEAIESDQLHYFVPYNEWKDKSLMYPAILDAMQEYAAQQTPAALPDEDEVREFGRFCWQAAANAYRMYPDNKHTFADFWSNSGKQEMTKWMQSNLSTPTGEGEAVDWIPVSERSPDYEVEVLVARPNRYSGKTDVIKGYLHKATPNGQTYGRRFESKITYGDWWSFPAIAPLEAVTHWMPLPEPPKQQP